MVFSTYKKNELRYPGHLPTSDQKNTLLKYSTILKIYVVVILNVCDDGGENFYKL